MITYDDFKKVEMRMGTILSAERVPDTDKLIRFKVNFGDEERQIVSGIAGTYPNPEQLVGKQFPFVTNLEAREIRGLESQGMIVACATEEGIALLEPNIPVPPGSSLS
jgi:methionine--tRNA ligase beta chain